MNDSLYSIDRSTHAKIVALALIAATAIAGISIAVRCSDLNEQPRFNVLKAGKPALIASRVEIAVR
ncbi:MAG TPA: hypothetical protein VFK01_11805 [Bradyrhizobium sp.]|jgi:hypothetical protein|nr:hypothetical protein [Bradyrhizobium sp.]